MPPSSGIFESINLNATMAIPESTDDEPDPTEFLLLQEKARAPSPPPLDSLNSTYSDLHSLSVLVLPFLEVNTTLKEHNELIEHFQKRHAVLTRELATNVDAHRQVLENGDDPSRIRSMIGQNLAQISQNYYSLHELYGKDILSTELLFSAFEGWDRRRTRILSKISTIKSTSNRHGHKLSQLLGERADIDSEIGVLEQKLADLRHKRTLVTSEIDKTASVLESRSSKYVELFRRLERLGLEAIHSFFDASLLPQSEVRSLVRHTPVDVKFRLTSPTTPELGESPTATPEPTHTTEPSEKLTREKLSEKLTLLAVGMQPYVFEEPPQFDAEDGHGKGPSAYERGFAQGAHRSESVRLRINNFLQGLLKEKPRPPPKAQVVDDMENTIVQKLDIEPIVTILSRKIDALEDLVLTTSKSSTQYHQLAQYWDDLVAVIAADEAKLSRQISESYGLRAELNAQFAAALVNSLTSVKSFVKARGVPRPKGADYIHPLVRDEIAAIRSGLALLTDLTPYLSLFSDLESFGLVGDQPQQELLRQDSHRLEPQGPQGAPPVNLLASAVESDDESYAKLKHE